MQVCTLASGSKGNSMVVSCGNTHILLDAGISTRRIVAGLERLGIQPSQLSAVLITHSHSDHTKGLATFTKKYDTPIYATCRTEPSLREQAPCLGTQFVPVLAGQPLLIDGVEILPFATPHDAEGSVGYRITWGGSTMALATDLGHITDQVLEGICGVNLLVAETNHDEDWVRCSPYPYTVQRRILGDYGHLSNETGAELILRAIQSGTQAVVLAHLSPENNSPAHALEAVQRRLRAEGICTQHQVQLSVAPEATNSPVLHIVDGTVVVEQEVAVC